MTGELLPFETIKEAFYRTFSGQGELWFSYFYNTEADRRYCVNGDWGRFLEHIQDVKGGKPFDPPKKNYLEAGEWAEGSCAMSFQEWTQNISGGP